MPTLREALAARGITDAQARKRERDRLRRVRLATVPARVPALEWPEFHRLQGAELTARYVRAFELLNGLRPTRVAFIDSTGKEC